MAGRRRGRPFFHRWGFALAFLAGLQAPAATANAANADALWAALRSGGHIAFMRHALAPGIGDPRGFRIDDCATQRNLSEKGRRQARATGDAFRQRRVRIGRVLSSQWCRCLETARLLNLGDTRPLPALNSFFETPSEKPTRLAELREFLRGFDAHGPSIVLVTHQVTITGLTGVFPQSGEIVVLKPTGRGGFAALGAIDAF